MKNLKIIFNIETTINVIAVFIAIMLLFDAYDYYGLNDNILSYIAFPVTIMFMGTFSIAVVAFIVFCVARFIFVKYYINSIERKINLGKLKAYPIIILNVVTFIMLLPFMLIGYVPYNIYVCIGAIIYILFNIFTCRYVKKIKSK